MKAITMAATAVALALVLGGCAAPAEEAATDVANAEGTPAPAADPTTSGEPVEPAKTTEPPLELPESDRGYLIKEIGEESGLTGDNDEVLMVFTVDSIERDPKCTSAYAEKPANGHFLMITITAQTFPELSENDVDSVSFGEWSWEAYSANGVRLNDPVGTGYSCLSSNELIPTDIGPGQMVTGKVVLDVADLHGTVAYVPYVGLGWEWSY